MLIFCDPPTCRAQAGRPSASWRQAHPNVALGDRAWPRVIVPCKDWPSATAYGGCGLDKGLSPGPRLPPRDRWRRPFARANGGSANLSTPGSIPMSVEVIRALKVTASDSTCSSRIHRRIGQSPTLKFLLLRLKRRSLFYRATNHPCDFSLSIAARRSPFQSKNRIDFPAAPKHANGMPLPDCIPALFCSMLP